MVLAISNNEDMRKTHLDFCLQAAFGTISLPRYASQICCQILLVIEKRKKISLNNNNSSKGNFQYLATLLLLSLSHCRPQRSNAHHIADAQHAVFL